MYLPGWTCVVLDEAFCFSRELGPDLTSSCLFLNSFLEICSNGYFIRSLFDTKANLTLLDIFFLRGPILHGIKQEAPKLLCFCR